MPSIEEKVNEHDREIQAIHSALQQTLSVTGDLNKNMNELCQKLAIYIERHEHTQESLKRLHERQERLDAQHNKQALVLAAHAPVIETVRGAINKVLMAFIAALFLIVSSGYLAFTSLTPPSQQQSSEQG